MLYEGILINYCSVYKTRSSLIGFDLALWMLVGFSLWRKFRLMHEIDGNQGPGKSVYLLICGDNSGLERKKAGRFVFDLSPIAAGK